MSREDCQNDARAHAGIRLTPICLDALQGVQGPINGFAPAEIKKAAVNHLPEAAGLEARPSKTARGRFTDLL
jgi:hypothetical protein